MRRPGGPRRTGAPADAEAKAEDLYERMRASVDRMRAADRHQPPGLPSISGDIRELLLHLVELVVLAGEDDR